MKDIDPKPLVSELACSPVEEFNAILINRTVWYGKVMNYFRPQNVIDAHGTICKIRGLIEKDPSALKQPTFIKDVIQLINKLDAHVYSLFESNPNSENEKCLSSIFSFERYILTHISGDQTKNLEVIQSIQSRLVPGNVISYLVNTNFSQNITLATACCSYIEKKKIIGLKNLREYLIKNPGKALDLLNAGCLAKNDVLVKAIWEIICLNKNPNIFKADKKLTSALDYLINKKEYSNQTLIVDDVRNPRTILVNRGILTQRNAYFNSLFQAGFVEETQFTVILKHQNPMIRLQGSNYKGFLYLLRYIYTNKVDIPLELCPAVSHLADIYLEPDLKKICDKKKRDQAFLEIENMGLVGRFQDDNYEKFFYSVHHSYTGRTDLSSVIMLKGLDIEKLQGFSYKEILYLLHYIYTGDKDVPLTFCPGVSYLAGMYSEPDLKEACDQKMLQAFIRW